MDLLEFFFDKIAIAKYGTPLKRVHKNKTKTKTKNATKTLKISSIIKKEKSRNRVTLCEKIKKNKAADIPLPVVHPGRTEKFQLTEFYDKINNKNLKNGKIVSAQIEGVIVDKLNFFGIIRFLYDFIDDLEQIKKNTCLRIIEGKHTEKGFVPFDNFNISVQGVPSFVAVKEICNQVIANNISMKMEIIQENNHYLIEHDLTTSH